jgi:hypothetical protein
MQRKSLLLTLLSLGLLAGVLLAVGTLLVQHEPRFYRERALAADTRRQQQSRAFLREFSQLLSDTSGNQPRWQAEFTEEQINSFLQEDFLQPGRADKLLPEGVSAPRVALETDTVRLGFRYRLGPWSPIISVAFRVWLPTPPQEVNVVALELQSLHAGALPISAQSLLEQISDIARRGNIDVTWYRHEGNPVALLRFQSDRPRPLVQLKHLQIGAGRLLVGGESLDRTRRVRSDSP